MANEGNYTEDVLNYILADLETSPLSDGEELNLIGYSGGGQIILNVAEELNGKYVVDNTVLIGAPVMEFPATNTGTIVVLWSPFDMLSWNIGYGDIKYDFVGFLGHRQYLKGDNLSKTAKIIDKYINRRRSRVNVQLCSELS